MVVKQNDFNSQPGRAALLNPARSESQLSAIGVYGYWLWQRHLLFHLSSWSALGYSHSVDRVVVVGQAKS